MSRPSLPTLDKIARHWVDHPLFENAYFQYIGFGEPYCFRCQWQPPNDDPYDDEQTWQQHSAFLDKCHLVDRCRGGSDELDNLVPLCNLCHKEMPQFAPHQYDIAIAWVNEIAAKESRGYFTVWCQKWWELGILKTRGNLKHAWNEYRKAMVEIDAA